MADNKFTNTFTRCIPMSTLQSVIGGKWKILILWYISFFKVQRFGELMRRLDGITQSTLTKQLRELEKDGFIHREIYKEIPPKVEYTLTELGESFIPVLQTMMNWSEKYYNLSEHGRRMIDGIMDLELHLMKQVTDTQERLLCVWVPVTYMEDGMIYDSCHMRYLKVKNSVGLERADFALQITSNAFMPVFYEGDIVLISHRFPKPGEAALFMRENLMYLRKYQMTKEGARLIPVNMEERFYHEERNRLSVQLCAGVICGVFRGEILMEYCDKEGRIPLEQSNMR